MKKLVAALIVLCLIIVGFVGYTGSKGIVAIPQGTIGDAQSPADPGAVPGSAAEPGSAAAAPAGSSTAPAESAPYEMPKIFVDYETIYALHGADEMAYKVGDREGSWGDFFYLLYTQSSDIEQYLATMAMYGMPMSWEDKLEPEGDETYADYAVETAQKLVVQLTALEIFAEENGVEMDEEFLAKVEEQKQADIIKAVGEEGTEEEFFERLDGMYLSRDMYHRITLQNLLYQESFKKIYGEKGENVTDEQALAWLEENQYISAMHILIQNTDSATGEKLDEDTLATKKADLETLLEELRAIEDPEERAAAFAGKMTELSEDPGKTNYPEGYTFKPGAMVPEFEEGAIGLEDYEISDVIETSYGYHIIMRLPLSVDRVVEFNSNTGEPRTARMLAANQEYGEKLQALADSLTFEWLPGFEAPVLTDYLTE